MGVEALSSERQPTQEEELGLVQEANEALKNARSIRELYDAARIAVRNLEVEDDELEMKKSLRSLVGVVVPDTDTEGLVDAKNRFKAIIEDKLNELE